MNRFFALCAILLTAASCATTDRSSSVERMYVIDCGENRTNDVSRWTPGVNVASLAPSATIAISSGMPKA